ETHNRAHRMEPSPPEKKLTRLLRTFVKGWVEQLFVGWQYDHKRKGNDRYQQHAAEKPSPVALGNPGCDRGNKSQHSQRSLHDGRTTVARPKFSGCKFGAALHPRWMLHQGDVDSRACEQPAGQHRPQTGQKPACPAWAIHHTTQPPASRPP